jgi:hypothetical protein
MLLLEFVFFPIFYHGHRERRRRKSQTYVIILDKKKSMSRNISRRRDDLDEYWFEKIAVTTKVVIFEIDLLKMIVI